MRIITAFISYVEFLVLVSKMTPRLGILVDKTIRSVNSYWRPAEITYQDFNKPPESVLTGQPGLEQAHTHH